MKRLVLLLLFIAPQAAVAQSATGVVTGRLLSIDGTTPAAGVRVSAAPASFPASFPAGAVVLIASAQTDGAGRYRLEEIPPGSYYIVAGLTDAPTYYPGVNDMASARIVTVTLGTPANGIDFAMARPPGFTISGRIVVPPNASTGPLRLTLTAFNTTVRGVANADGSFEFNRLRAGNYTLRVDPTSVAAAVASTPVMIALVDKDVDDVEMIFSRTVTVTTNVVVDGGGVVPNFALALVPYRGGQTTVSLAYTGLGEVRTRVPEGDYRVAWSSLPAGYQIKSITTGMTDLLVNPFKVAIEGNPPHIAVNLGVSSPPPWVAVSGRITGLTQADFAGPLRLSLVPRENGATPETAIQEDGSFEFPMVLPGPYAVRLTPRGPIPDLTAIAVRSRDIRGLEIAAPPGKPVTIRFAVEGNGPPPRTMELVLDGVSTGSHLSQPDGTFRVRFPLGTHRVTLGVGSYTMKEMRYGGADVIRQPMVVALTDTAELLVSVGRNINVSVSIDASGPNCVTCPAPPYPEPARATAITDTVVLSVSVAADGTVQDVKVIRGHQLLAQAAVDAVRQWRFRPQPAPAQASVAISFDAR